ncbi:phage tail protein [Klebsiella pneumoniae]|uniref:phage tail tip fiber protein n=1 Tax=Klebsiella pneumoniae TaxID=573 RepID=UPI002014FB19|nr:phage tail protein [Klebsiella pneumoniae]MCL3157287.1 phage tail protein [Klebsiella pneumoniae]MCL3163054.1 phage tail protein [Klebsiella pneumoniae]MDY1654424.1 phage tail protein [Klebsiella pneumoniae]URU16091.1 phage tail protein [Klebsiella pneumoniae]URU21687.1 phage tail protein [Klebsiella pneumoniae]
MDQFKKKRLPLLIAGAGGKKSSGSSRTPVEADDTVNSRAMASILDLLGEGVVGGLINGAKSIFIDGVALENEDGSFNYSGVTWDFRDGSQDQSPMPGFDFVETPKAVNTQLKTTNAVTVAIDNDDADRVRVIMKFPSLRSIDKKTGDTNGTSVQFKFQLANGNGSFYDVIATGEISSDVTLTAKKTGVYYRSYEIQLPKPGRAYKVRVLRLSADSNDQYLFNDTWVDSIGEIVDTPMNYPNSVLVGLKVNSEQFGSSMPSRSYLIRGLKIRVPSNYDENTNTYNGVWDGTFKLLSSSNPAWILFDLLTNARYGLGKFVSESMIDLGQLYQIGRYCDEEVDDGFGGKEKRFAINTQITSRQDAYRLIQDIAGAFRGMVFWAGGMVNIMQDSPSDPVMLFTNANVKDGLFTYKGSARKDRPSVALITYNNKQDGYKQNVEYVEDQEAMARYGERKTEAVAFGCTSRGQAHRVGLWLLYTARMESDMITFTAGLDASFLMPGETVLIQNKYRAGKRNSGRIVSFTKNSITLDAPVSLKKSGSFIRIINQEGKIVERDINETGDNITKVTFKTALATADQPVANGVWTITEPDLVPMRARVVAIAQGETPGSFDITVVQNNASKYQAIDNGATLVPENTTVLDPTYSKPSNLVISEGTYLSSPGNLSVKLMLAWEGKSPEYWVSWRRSDEGNVSNWQSARATEEQYEIVNVAENGRYDFRLYSVSFGGKKSEIITAVYQVKGTMTPPGAPTSLTAVGDYRNVVLNWVNPDSVDLAQINVYASKTNKLDTATLIAQAATTTFTHAGLGDNETWYYWIRAVNKRGMVGQPNSNLGTEATTRDVLSFLKDKITSSELGKELLDEIDSKATQEAVDNAIGEVQNSVNESIQQVENDLAQTSSEIKAQVDSVNQSLKENIDTVNQTIVDNIDTVNQTINTNISNVNSQIEAAKQSIKDGDAALSQEIKKAQSSLTTSLSQTSKDLTAAIQKETNDRIADVNDAAKQAADQLLSAKNELKTSIDSLSEVVTSGDENLARQISQIAAGTGEQFDSLKIWYFDQDAEGWTEDDNGYTPMSVTSDGWLKANNPTSTCRSPNGLTIDAHAYRFIKMRIKKVGNPTWNAKMFWIGADETGWNAGRSVVINEPEYDDKGIAILTLHDLEWRDSTTIRRFRFDFTSGQDADNYLLFDWIAVGRPTPGAGMAALQEEQQARANADTAEAQARSTLAAQIRGSSESGNLDDIRSGLIYQEKNARITADAAEASARESLQTEFNRNKASVAEELHTLSTEQASQASKITGLQTSLGQKADASAVQTISQKVEEQGNTLKSQGAALSTLDNRVGSVESGVSANSKAITGLQSTVTQQDKTLSSQSESITTLNNSLSDIQSDTDTAKSNPSNLLVNASFERDLAGWSAGNSVSSVIKASAPHSGSKILVCAAGTVQIAQSVSVVEGRTYKLSSFVRCTTDAVISSPGNNKLRIGAATLLKEIPIRPENLPKDETWKEVSDTWKATLTGKVDVSIMSSLKTGSQYFDDVGFVDVTDALAIEANASATNALTSRVSSVEGTITSQGQQITSMQNSIKNKADASAVTNLTNRVTAAENQISSQSQSITSLSNSLDNANADADASKAIIGNMLKNNSFERGFEGWEYVGWTLLEAQNPKSGKYIIQAGKLASGGDSGCNQTVELQAGKTYRIGAWVRKSADFAINNAGNNKISLRNADLTPLKDIPITGAGLSTNWALISGEYTPAKTASVVVSLRASVASGYMYLDDVFCVDVSNEKAIDATSNALSTLNSTVTQQGKDITSNSNSITSLSNQMVNGRQNMWMRSVYNVQLANSTIEPTFSDINGKAPTSIEEVPDAAKLDFASAGSYVIAHYKAFVKVNADTTITMAPGARVFDDTGAVYVNGVRVAFGNASWNTVSFDLKAGWSTVEFLVNQWTGQAYINLGFKLSEKVAQLNSALGMNALSNAISAVTSNVSTVGDRVTSTSQSVTDLRNSLEQTNVNLANKADAQALSTLQNTVSKQGDTISSQGNSITNLNNTLTAARNSGDNLIPNYDFLQGATAWDTQYPAGVTFGNFGDGKAGVKLNRTTTTSPGIFSNNNKPLPLNGQRKYRVVVKAKGVSGAMNMLIRRQNKIGQTDSNYEDKNVTLTSEWQTITWETGLTASNADGQNFKLYAHPANAEIWVDTFKVFDITDEVKIKANSDALSTLSSTVTQQGDKITSQGNSITKLTNDLEAADANIAKKADQSAVTTLTGRVEKTESGLTAANSNITSLSSSLSQQSKRGANLLPDGTFESYAVGHNLSNNRVIVTTDDSHGGNKCIRVTRPNDYNANATDNSDNHIFSGFQVRDNAVFYMECWVKRDAKSTAMAENAQISIGLSLQYQDNSWQWPAVTKAAKDLSSTQWTKVSGYLKSTKSGIKQAMVRISIPNVSSVKAGNSFLIDDLVITEVTDAYNAQSTADANANAISTLDSTVSQQGDQITSQGNSITKLTNDLATTNNNVSKKADQSALSVLSGRVDQTESGLSSANSSITALNSSVRAGNATSGDLISNPTFDPEFSQMGFTVVSSSSEGVPANCPYAYVARIAARDHHPNFAAIPATLGDVYEMSALVACGTGSADFNLYLGTATRPSGSVGAPLSSGGNRKASATWQRVTWRFKITQGIVDRGFFRPFLQINQSSPFGTVWYVTDWHLRNVTDSSKVQDSLDATAKAVDSLTSTVNQQGENILSIGTRTTNLENNLRTTNANVAQKADANALTALTNRVTQTEKDINSTSSSVTNLNNKVDAISVGGTNLIKNSGDMTGWSNVVSDTYRGNAVIGATVKAGSGYRDLREIMLESPVDAGEYVYSFYAKGGVAGQTMTAFFYNPNTTTSIETSQGAKGNNSDGRAQFTLTTSWARYWVKWKQTPTTGTKRLILCRIESNTSKDQTVYINSPKFEVGNVVSDWNESPSDSASASAVDSLTTKVNQQGTSISSIGNRTTSLENGLSTAQNNIAKKADASALQDLRNTVTSQGGDLTAANSSITSLQASMNRRTVFTVTARGNGNSVTPGIFDESGKNLFPPGRSWALVTFTKHSDGSTVIATSKTYDVFGSANNGATMSADIEALASGTYVCVLTFDEPTGNRGKVLSALESLGGTSEVVNSLPYRGAYILLGRKGMKPGDGLELRAPTGGDGTAHISTSVEFVNGVMMGLGAAGGVMMKADANASAITTLQNTVKTQGDNIDSLSSSTTALENSLASSNASVDAASQIPGNLIVNPSFERGTEGYTGWSGIATVATLQVPHLGTKAAKLAAGGSAGVGQKISFKKDRSYKIGIWAKQDPNTTIQSTDNTKFRVADGTGLIASKAYGPFTSNWQEVSWTWKATKDVIADVQFTAFLSAGAMYFDDFYVVDVTDSVETQANSSAITKLDSRVTKTENDITSQGSQVTQLKNDLATTNTNVSKKADAAALTALTNRVTQNEKQIETQSSQTTSLKNSLSTVQAMGSNPWFDGSLETYSENQQISGSRAVVVSSQKRSGTKSLRVSRGAGEGGNSDKSIGKWIALRENAVFRIELWAMMPADQSPSSGWSTIVGLQTQNAANNNNWPSAITITEGSLGGRGTWKKFTGTLRVATGHTRGVFWISTRGSTGAGTPGYDLYIDDVVVTDITDAKEAQDSANANASALTSLTSRVTNVEGQVTSQASQLSSLTSQVNDASSKVDQMAQTITNNEKTQSSLNTSLQSQIDAQASANIKNQTELNNATTSLAAIKSTQQTQATTISALSQQQTNLTAQVGGQSAELQELKKTVVENGNVNSTWMVKMETNSNGKKYAAGIALGIDGKNLQSQFLVQADRFGLINTSNGNTTTPFVVENGVAYMNAAVIKDGSITNAKIGGEIRSDNFVNGSNGWRIGKDGSSQFNNVVIRGEVHANTGVLNNVTINENCTVLGTVQANKIVGDVVTMTDRVVKNWPASGNTSSGTRYLIATIDGMPFERRMVFNGSVAIVQVWRQNVTIRVDETTVWTFDSGNDGKDFETSIFSIRIPASNFGQRHQITIQWPNRGDSGQFRFTGVVSMYRTTGSISLA